MHVFIMLFGQDMLSEALLCFGASSTSTDEQDNFEKDDEVHLFNCLELDWSDT